MNINFRPYLPGILSLFFAWLCIKMPGIAVFIVSGILFFFGTIYIAIVYKVQQRKKYMQDHMKSSTSSTSHTSNGQQANDSFSGINNINEPNFSNVTTFIFKNGRWIADSQFKKED